MSEKRMLSWLNFPVIFIGLVIVGFAASRGEAFVKHTDSDVSNYRAPAASPVYLNNKEAGEVVYFKKGDNEPALVTPLKDEIAVASSDKKLSTNYFELNNNRAGEVVYFKSGDNEPARVTPLRKDEIVVDSSEKNLSAEDVELIAAKSPEALETFIVKYAPAELAFVGVQRLAQPFLDAKDWGAARAIFEKYSAKFPAKSLAFSKIYGILDAPGGEVVVNNLGSGINSLSGEYAPVISSNGKKLIFAKDCGVCEGGEEVYLSTLNDSGKWGVASKFGFPLASRSNEIPLALSSDGNTLAVFGNYDAGLGRGDIFHLDKNRDGWGKLQHYQAPLNSEYFESNATYSPDGSAILFISERPGGVGEFHKKGSFYHGDYNGNTDIYAFVPDDSIGGGVVRNLGSVINTPYAEYSPFLHPDGKTLYFSSNGHPGLGALDVFKSTRLRPDSWTEWSEPVNLGKDINTPHNDWGYQFDAHGDKAYFAVGNRADGFGGSDIYTVSLPGQFQPGGVLSVSGKVTDSFGNFLSADLRWNDLLAGKEVGRATSDPQNGEYIIHLPAGGKYAYYAEKAGYMGQSENFDLTEEFGYREFVMDIVLYPIAKPADEQPRIVAEIRMNNVFFDFDKSSLRSESKLELDRWVKMLNENPSVSLEIDGHTDSIGTESYNLGLSERRVKSVAKYIEKQGIAAGRLTTRGFGEKKPVATNKTALGRQTNRRVEVRIIYGGRPEAP